MAPRCLTVLAPIQPASEANLRRILRAIGDDINCTRCSEDARPHIAFTRSRAIHFARFAILNDPDRGSGRTRLLFASVYDGPLDTHLDELVSITSDMDAIWGACEGYTGIAEFPFFIRAHAHETGAYYIAFRDETVESITNAIAARRQRHARQDGAGLLHGAETVRSSPTIAGQIFQTLQKVIRAAPIVTDLIRALARHGFGSVAYGTKRITASLDRYFVFRLFNRITGNRIPPRKSPFSCVALDQRAPFAPLAPGDEIPAEWTAIAPAFREDAVAQNQLTLVTVVDPAFVHRVGAVMASIDSYSRRLAPPGSLIGISSIHFARWLPIDSGRRLLFISDYDGSWESYIDEFAEMILSGLDAIWRHRSACRLTARETCRHSSVSCAAIRCHRTSFLRRIPTRRDLNVASDRAARPSFSRRLDPLTAR